MANTISTTMATLIKLDTMQPAQQMRTIKNAIAAIKRESQNAADALEQTGNSLGSAQQRWEGYNSALKRQTDYIKVLEDEHKQLGLLLADRAGNVETLTNKLHSLRNQVNSAKQAYDDLRKAGNAANNQSAIDEAKRKLDEYRQSLHDTTKQLNDLQNGKADEKWARQAKQIENARAQQLKLRTELAKSETEFNHQISGLGNLQDAYKNAQRQSKIYTDRLTAEHKKASAAVSQYNATQQALENLRRQYQAQNAVLDTTRERYGETADQTLKEKERLDQIATSIAKTKDKALELNRATMKFRPTPFTTVNTKIMQLHDTTGRLGDRMSATFDRIKQHALGLSVIIGGIGAGLIKGANEASKLEDQYLKTKNLLVTGGENAGEASANVKKMQSGGRDLSIAYGVDQRDIAAGYQELTKRGYTSSQSLGAMKTMLQASVASGDDLKDVIESSTGAIESFGLRANGTRQMIKNTKKAVNQMAYAADMTATDYQGLATGMQYAGPQGRTLGYGVGQVASALGVLSNNGLEAEKAGTGMREVLNSLVAPSSNGKKALKSIGLKVSDFKKKNGNMKSLVDIFKLLDEHTKDKGGAEKAALFKRIFGATGESAATILLNNTKQLAQVQKGVNDSYKGKGYVEKLAKKNMGSSKMATRQFKQASNAVGVTLGKSLMPALRDASVQMAKFLNSAEGKRTLNKLGGLIRTVTTGVVNFGKALAKHKNTVKAFAVVLGILFAAGKVMSFVLKMKQAVTIIGGVSQALKLLRLAFLGTGIGAAIAAVAALTVGFIHLYKTNAKFRDFIKGIGVILKNAFKVIVKFSPAGILISGFLKLYKHNKRFRNFINGLANTVKKIFGGMFNWIKNKIDAIKNGAKKLYNKVANIGHSGSASKPAKKYAAGTSGTIEDQIAMVNDATDPDWREMLLRNNRLYAFPKRRNVMTYLKQGDQVINGTAAKKIAQQRGFRHFADGKGDEWSAVNINDRGATAGLQNDFKSRLGSQYDTHMAYLTRLLREAKATQQRTIRIAQQKAAQLISAARRVFNLAIARANQVKAQAIAKAQNVFKQAQAQAKLTYEQAQAAARSEHAKRLANAQNSFNQQTAKAKQMHDKQQADTNRRTEQAQRRIEKMKISRKRKNKKLYDLDGKFSNRMSAIEVAYDKKVNRQNQLLKQRRSNAESSYSKVTAEAARVFRNANINANATLRTATASADRSSYDARFEANKSLTSSQRSANDQLAKSTQSANATYNKAAEKINKQIAAVRNWKERIAKANRYANGTDGVDSDQMAIVNDGAGSNWQELMYYNGTLLPFPHRRNILSFIPRGAQIINGDNTAKLMNQSVNHFYDGVGALNSYITDLNTAGDVSHNESRKSFVKQLQSQFKNYMQQINDSLKQLKQTLDQARQTLSRALTDAAAEFSKARFDAQSDYSNAMEKARAEMQTAKDQNDYTAAFNDQQQARQTLQQALNEANQTRTNSINQANAEFSKTSQTVQRQRSLAVTNKARLNDWYNNNISQFDKAAAQFANGGIATAPSIFGEAGPEAAVPLDAMKQGNAWQSLQKVVDYYAGNSATTPQQTAANDRTNDRTNELLTTLISIAGSILQRQADEASATRQTLSGINGYDKNAAFKDTSEMLRQAQLSNLTY